MARHERKIARIERKPGAISFFTREIAKQDFSAPPGLGGVGGWGAEAITAITQCVDKGLWSYPFGLV